MSTLEFHQVSFESYAGINYLVLVHDPESGATALVDAGDADCALDAAKDKGWTISEVWITHHHSDHVEGLAAIKAATGARAIGPRDQSEPIDHLDDLVGEGDTLTFGGHKVEILHTPGHTNDMINFHIPSQNVVFTGDTLFSLGCGRMFEGTPAAFWASMQKLAALPGDTMVYCGHEYTEGNANFALTVDPDNQALIDRAQEVKELRAAGKPTVPFNLGQDVLANPFMRANDPTIQQNLGMSGADEAEIWREIRARKDAG